MSSVSAPVGGSAGASTSGVKSADPIADTSASAGTSGCAAQCQCLACLVRRHICESCEANPPEHSARKIPSAAEMSK
eukprot:8726073-Pyramimonas_sp.AAC.1